MDTDIFMKEMFGDYGREFIGVMTNQMGGIEVGHRYLVFRFQALQDQTRDDAVKMILPDIKNICDELPKLLIEVDLHGKWWDVDSIVKE